MTIYEYWYYEWPWAGQLSLLNPPPSLRIMASELWASASCPIRWQTGVLNAQTCITKGHRMPVDGAGDYSDQKALLIGAVTAYSATIRHVQ